MNMQYVLLILVILVIGIYIIDDVGHSEKYYHYDEIVVKDVHSYGELSGAFDVFSIIDEQGRVFKIHEDAYKKLMNVYDNNPLNHTLLIHHQGGYHHYFQYVVDNITTESGIVITNS